MEQIIFIIIGINYLYLGYLFGHIVQRIWNTGEREYLLAKKILWPWIFVIDFTDDPVVKRWGEEDYCFLMAFVWPLKVAWIVISFAVMAFLACIFLLYNGLYSILRVLFYPIRKILP